jgi:hypothetical protein
MPHLAFDCAPKIVGVGMTVHDGYSPVFISHLEGCERAVSGWRNAICPRVVGVSAASPRVAQGMSHLVEFADVDLSGVLFTSLIVVVRAWSPEVGTRDLLTLREEHSGCANVGPSPSRKRSPGPPFRHHPLKASCIEKLGMRGAQQVAKKGGTHLARDDFVKYFANLLFFVYTRTATTSTNLVYATACHRAQRQASATLEVLLTL